TGARASWTESCSWMADHRDVLGTALGQPDLARAAEDLAHRGARARQCEGLEALAARIEAQHRVGAEIAEPHGIELVDIHRIGLRRCAGQPPAAPGPRGRVVHRHLPAVPLADPQAP